MIAPLLAHVAQLAAVVCVVDATTGAPIVAASVQAARQPAGEPAAVVASAPRHTLRGACETLPLGSGGTIRITRAGYVPQQLRLAATGDTLVVRLTPAARAPQTLATQRVTATAAARPATVTQEVRDARDRGAGTTAGLLTLLPYIQLRTARGETGLSLRGARREQVLLTLDGLPLNDPATGLADVSDLPLAALGSATVAPGADPIGAGLGATGGVLALTTRAQRLVSLRTGAFGTGQLEAATAGTVRAARWHGAASWHQARNDFAFVNDAGAAPVRETRVNNDERRFALSGGVVQGSTQLSLLASTGERGMVGPANVRSYDQDRARTTRLNARLQHAVGPSLASAGLRTFTLAYRDPTRPVFDSRARAWAADLDWRGALGPGTWRLGAGGDGLTATGGITQQRRRAFAAYGVERALARRGHVEFGARADAVERLGLRPTGSLGLSWRLGSLAGLPIVAVARTAQALRVPTLYDLYFASPQRLTVRPLAPERVTLDASAGLTARAVGARRDVSAELLAVSRDTREAIVWFPGNFGWSPANVGREALRGVEARAAIGQGAWHADGWLTAYDAQLFTNGLRIPTPYVSRVAAGLRALHAHRLATVSTNARYVGRRPYTAGPRNAAYELPAVWLLDAAVSHRRSVPRTDLLVTLALDNATNARWQSVRGFPMPGRSWSLGITLEPMRHP